MKPPTTVLATLLRLYLTITLPILLVIGSIRLVMNPAFLYFEYTRSGFPEDFYGFTTEDRLQYAPYAIDYLLNSEDINYLGDLRFPDGLPLYNERELTHMVDVKVVTQAAFAIGALLGIGALISGFVLWRNRNTHIYLYRGLFDGSLLTLGIIATIILLAVTSWDFFFTGFHDMFFAEGTWVFFYSDTLIRLFPEQFWFDAALTIGSMTTLSTLIVLAITWRKRFKRSEE